MVTFDFVNAKLKHSAWKSKMRSFLNGTVPMSQTEAVSHRDCELGKWIYSDGMKQFGSEAEFQELEKVHQQMHAQVSGIIAKKNAGDTAAAEAEFTALSTSSGQIMGLLDTMDNKMNS